MSKIKFTKFDRVSCAPEEGSEMYAYNDKKEWVGFIAKHVMPSDWDDGRYVLDFYEAIPDHGEAAEFLPEKMGTRQALTAAKKYLATIAEAKNC